MSASQKASLTEQLRRGPAYLFLGQRWLTQADGKDPFLTQVLNKFGGRSTGPTSYLSLFDSKISDQTAALEWMAGRCPNIPVTERIERIAQFPWNGVVTSAIDDVGASVFRNTRRDVQRVLSLDYQPSDSRSRSKLHLWYLFGNVAASDAHGRPPLSRLDLVRRKGIATQMAGYLKELVTFLGTLCIESYDPTSDWFDFDLFYMLVSSFEKGQVHWFGADKVPRDNAFVQTLLEEERLVLHSESLAQVLLSADRDSIRTDEYFEDDAWTRTLRIARRVVTVPEDLFREVLRTSRLVTERAFAVQSKRTPDERYAEFRAFLYESSHSPAWEGYANGYAFRRDFQDRLEDVVRTQLLSGAEMSRKEPVILHGATGSGKTIALGQLAFDTQRQGQHPVLFIDRGTRSRTETLARFCRWAELSGGEACLVIWDGMVALREYLELHAFFQSRGRKVVLVGSVYQTDVNVQKPRNAVCADPKMTEKERKRFVAFLDSIGLSVQEGLAKRLNEADETFLGQLYRQLPPSRSALQAGLGREVFHAGEFIRQKRLQTVADDSATFGTNLGNALAALGIDVSGTPFGDKKELIGGEKVDEVQQLVGLIMVPGQFGLGCPFDLLMRTVGRDGGRNLIDVLRNVDIFQIRQDDLDNPTVEPRTALEALLIVRRSLGSPKSEVDYATRLLANIRTSFVVGTREIDFAVELLRSIGPNGLREGYFRPYFAVIAACLRTLRVDRGISHPRLLLQESAFLREAAKGDERPEGGHSSEKRKQLNQALEACEEGLKQLKEGPFNRLMRARLLVEMASAWGSLATMEPRIAERLQMVKDAQDRAWKAFTIDLRNYYALDVIAWTARDILQQRGLSAEDKIEVVESVTAAFAVADMEEWEAVAADQLDRRRVELKDLIFNSTVSDKAFENLLARGSASGIVVRAFQIAESWTSDISEERRASASKALSYLADPRFQKAIEASPHAAFLRFKLWWRSRLGYDPNDGERIALPFSREDWDRCSNLVAHLLAFEEFREHPTLRLIEAVAFFHRGDSASGFEAFSRLSSDQILGRNRIIRRFMFSDQHGKAKRFGGRVVRLEEREGALLVHGLGRWVPFFAREVNRPDVHQGDDLDGFAIAFNMLGPIAEFRRFDPR